MKINKENINKIKTKVCSILKKNFLGIIAIFIAWLPFYYQYIRKDNNVKATILSFAMDHPDGINYVSDVVFVNNGNQPCSITNVEVQFQNTDTNDPIRCGLLSSPCINQSPFTIKPNEVITKQFWIGKGGIEDIQFNAYGKKDERINFSLAFEIIDSSGNYHKVSTPICFKKVGEESVKFPERIPKIVTLLPSKLYKKIVSTWPRKIEK